jgi:sugar O-acyltransferase (sialic acid O-acetyltransferase NeuD family)
MKDTIAFTYNPYLYFESYKNVLENLRKHYKDSDVFIYFDSNREDVEKIKPLSELNPNEYEVLIAIGDPIAREEVVNRLPIETKYFTFIHPSVIILGNNVEIGNGSIICAGTIITTNCKIGKHTHLNLMTTIGHDCVIGNFFTTAPGVKISGNCNIDKCVYVGTNASIKQKINICDYTTIGLNAGVVKHIEEPGTYVGTPAKKIK